MPPPPSGWLNDIGIAEFAPEAVRLIAVYSQTWAQVRSEVSAQEESFRAFIEFGAVEFALAPLYDGAGEARRTPNQILPIKVSDSAAADAIFKTDCGPFMEHAQKLPSELKPWDIFAFAGDMSKLELLGLSEDINALADPKNMEFAVTELAMRYDRAGFGDRIVESGILAAQGLIWFAKLAVLRQEDYTEAQNLKFAARFLRRGMPMV
jgi:hypothetical protein